MKRTGRGIHPDLIGTPPPRGQSWRGIKDSSVGALREAPFSNSCPIADGNKSQTCTRHQPAGHPGWSPGSFDVAAGLSRHFKPRDRGQGGGVNPPLHQTAPGKKTPLLIQEGWRASAGVVTVGFRARGGYAGVCFGTGWLQQRARARAKPFPSPPGSPISGLPSDPRNRGGWLAAGAFTSRGEKGALRSACCGGEGSLPPPRPPLCD